MTSIGLIKSALLQGTKRRRKMRLRFLIELACLGFLEGADAFSLIELFQREPIYYASNIAITNAILFFISISILIINYVNIIVTFPVTSRLYRRLWRLLVALVGNVPLILIRCWALSIHGGLDFVHFGGIYILFIVKELTLVTLSIGEYVMEECVTWVTKKRLAKEEDRETDSATTPASDNTPPQEDNVNNGSFFSTSFNLAASFASNSADKYRVAEDKSQNHKEKRRFSKSGRRSSIAPLDIAQGDPPSANPSDTPQGPQGNAFTNENNDVS